MWIFTKKSIEESFTTIFEKRRWPKGFPETVSGAGLNGITYVGIDIVASIVRRNSDRYGNERRTFHHADITADSFPIQPDLILCRDCFVHLTNDLIQQAISNIKRSGSTYLLTTTFPNLQKNSDLRKVGRWRPINLSLPPFNFPSALDVVGRRRSERPGLASCEASLRVAT